MTDGFLGLVIEGKIAEVRVGIEAAEIRDKEVHERAPRFAVVTGLFRFDRVQDGIRIRIIGVLARDHLFHFIRRPGTSLDDRFCPVFYRFIRLAPVMLLRSLPAHLSPQSFRVTVITDLLEHGTALEDVQHLAGHADPRTTRLYDRRQKKVMRNLVERISI
jgi:integrase